MAITSTAVQRGPALVTFGGATFYAKDGIRVSAPLQNTKLQSDNWGNLHAIREDAMHVVSFTPVGEWENLTVLFPYDVSDIGAGIFTGSAELVIHWKTGQKRTYHNVALTKMPDIILSAGKTLFGGVEFVCLTDAGTEIGASNSLYTDAALSYPGDSTFSESAVKTACYTVTHADFNPTTLVTEGGVVVSFDLAFLDEKADCEGTYDKVLTNLGVKATVTPLTHTKANIGLVDGSGRKRGENISQGAETLTVVNAAAGVYVYVYGAQATDIQYAAGNGTRHIGQITLEAVKSFTAGVPDPLYYVGTAAPV